jgi:drug/metabolite transporter (DMT)-like permease
MVNRAGLGIAAALTAAAIYGSVPPLVRGAFEHGVPAVESSFYRTSVIAVVLAMIAVARGESFVIPRAGWSSFALLALATLVISMSYLASVQFIPIALAVIIFYTFPIVILLSAPLVEGHKPGLSRILVGLFAFAGLAVAIGPGLDGLDWRGIALAAMASAAAALQAFSGRAISRHLDPSAFGSLVHVAIWLPSLLIVLWLGGGEIRSFPGGTATQAGYACVLALSLFYVGAYFFHMQSLKFAPASIVAPFFNLEPIVTIAIATLLRGEKLALSQSVGGAMVLAALILSSIIDLRRHATG